MKQEKETKINNIINFIGEARVGKTFIIENIAEILSKEKNKILIVDFDLEKEDISTILKHKYKIKNIKSIKLKNKKIKINPQNNKVIKINNKKIILKNKINNKKIILKYKINNKKENNKIKINRIKSNKTKKNKIKNSKLEKYINSYKFIKINKNIFLINNLKKYIKKNKNNLLNNLNNLNKLLIQLKKLAQFFDYILIEISQNNDTLLNKKILEITKNNIIIIEPDLVNLKKLKYEIINKSFQFNNYKIILNKYNKKSISKDIIKNIIKKIKIIGIIKYKNNKKIKNKLKIITRNIIRIE